MNEADPADVAAVWSGIASELELMPDPLERYHRVSADMALYQAVVELLSAERDASVMALYTGHSYAEVASATGMSRARVQQIVERGRNR